MAIVIKKRITLEFLGEEYKDSYLTFSSMSLREYESLIPKIEKIAEDGKKSIDIIKSVLIEHFIEGKFQDQDITADDLVDFDIDTMSTCFTTLTGQNSPKVTPQ